jgi:glycine/D-amino acid oxidase-like deaminating enzyme
VIGLSAARALREDGFAVTVYEQHSVGTRLGSSPGRSRIYRTSYRHDDYCRLARRSIDEWMRLDPALLLRNGLLEHGRGVDQHAAVLERCGEQYSWLEPAEAERLFPEARFSGPVLWTPDAGAVLADDALARLRQGVEVVEGARIADPSQLEADAVVVCPGSWLSRLYDLPVYGQIEQVCFFRGAPDSRPSLVDHGGERDDRFWYGVVSPGVGYKAAQDGARKGPFDPDRRDRRPARPCRRGAARPDSRAGAPGGLPLHGDARRRLHPRPDRRRRGLRRRQRPRVQVRSAAGAPVRRPGAGAAAAAGV